MSLPDAMSHTRRQHPPPARTPRGLLALVLLLTVMGALGLWASIQTGRSVQGATKQDVIQNRQLLEKVARLEAEQSSDVTEHRERNEELHADICRLIYEVIQVSPTLRDRGIQPCSPEQRTPSTRSTPFPTPTEGTP